MIRLRDNYDWLVLGDHPAALLSAGLAARLGVSVLVLPFIPGAGLVISKEGQYLDHDLNFLATLGRNESPKGLLAECLSRLGILPSEQDRVLKDIGFPQIVTPKVRVQFSPDEQIFLREMQRELGKTTVDAMGFIAALGRAEVPILSYWKSLPERMTLLQQPARKEFTNLESVWSHIQKQQSHKKVEKEWFTNTQFETWVTNIPNEECSEESLKEFFTGLNYGLTCSPVSQTSLVEMAHLFSLARASGAFRGGLTAYRDLLLRLAKRLGAHIPLRAECKRLFVEEGRLIGAQVAIKGKVVAVKGAVLGCSLEQAKPFISFSGSRFMNRVKTAPKPSGWRFSISIAARLGAIPVGMQKRVIWSEQGAPILEIEVAEPEDYGTTAPDQVWLFVRTVLPFTNESLKVAHQRMVAARMLRQVCEIMPFLEYNILNIFPDFTDENHELSHIYGYASKEMIPENLRYYVGEGLGSRTGIEGLFIASGESFPRLGTFGPTVAALEAVSWLAHRSGLSGPFA